MHTMQRGLVKVDPKQMNAVFEASLISAIGAVPFVNRFAFSTDFLDVTEKHVYIDLERKDIKTYILISCRTWSGCQFNCLITIKNRHNVVS